jgi:hypothetical protein
MVRDDYADASNKQTMHGHMASGRAPSNQSAMQPAAVNARKSDHHHLLFAEGLLQILGQGRVRPGDTQQHSSTMFWLWTRAH